MTEEAVHQRVRHDHKELIKHHADSVRGCSENATDRHQGWRANLNKIFYTFYCNSTLIRTHFNLTLYNQDS